MGGAAPVESKGGKRSMDAVINLVPYIDLLMTIMTFLVMTAVWTQLAVLEVQNSSGGQQEEKEKDDTDPPPPIFIDLKEGQVSVMEEGAPEPTVFQGSGDSIDVDGIRGALKNLKDARPERQQVNVRAEDGVKFTDIARVIDISTGVDLKGLTLQPASVQ